ncbi:hypothetical protein P8S54_00385 [Thiomicrospira sp. R3]|uniref:NAD-dependent epimerase/dehydratase family protein n=1 Tax=Thiomicrospira sp. R3 TaxID=3035472 RepID=UPI00259B69FA|nr:NAD-dependent epimerase/dehydratase family protein [Thiomicrospira sp. R3]WFE68790.1 hypothetical protein P8S54_00385 [Thiomicrospira sp. R3]
MNVFLTGATGFVGSALLSRFVADGVAVRALVRRRLDGLPDVVEQVVGDLVGFVDGAGVSVGDSGLRRNDGVICFEIPACAGMTG